MRNSSARYPDIATRCVVKLPFKDFWKVSDLFVFVQRNVGTIHRELRRLITHR